MRSLQTDLEYAYVLYLNNRGFREVMIAAALACVELVEPTEELFLMCGVTSEADCEVVDLFRSFARSYSICLPLKEVSEKWRIIKEFQLAQLGYRIPKASCEVLLKDRESVCVDILATRNMIDCSREIDVFIDAYKLRESDYEAFLSKVTGVVHRLTSQGGCIPTERICIKFIRFIHSYAYGGVGEAELEEVTKIMEQLLLSHSQQTISDHAAR